MSITDELRRMLDERGVEWCPSAWDRSTETYWKTADGNGCLATQGETKLRLSFADYFTPEQAIEATLGRGTCKPVDGYDDDGEEIGTCCSECGSPWPVYYAVRYCPVCGAKVVDDDSVD